ncbi:MAG: hypothetical protein COB09_19485 [Thalassobium sp.]|nr:MAG: hypothetical protein COB09_19485 [Thalassobium sp.]
MSIVEFKKDVSQNKNQYIKPKAWWGYMNNWFKHVQDIKDQQVNGNEGVAGFVTLTYKGELPQEAISLLK